MRLAEEDVALLLSEDGRTILSACGIAVEPLAWLEVDVVEAEELGLWIRLERDRMPEVLLLRWEYVLAVSRRQPTEVVRFGLKG